MARQLGAFAALTKGRTAYRLQRSPGVLSLWNIYLVGALVLIGAYFFVPGGTWTETLSKVAVGWAVTVQIGFEPGVYGTHLLDMTFLTAYTLLATAALHPSVREVGEKAQGRAARLSPWMLALLTLASLIAPGVLLIESLQQRVTDGVAIGVSSTALFLLVATRMAQLLHQVEAQARKLQELALVDELTGLANRRAWTSDLAGAIERARRG